jgi:hypothetical protein
MNESKKQRQAAAHPSVEENMAFGLYVMQDGSVMVAYGQKHVPISCAQYKANGYKPPLEKLAVKSPAVHKGAVECGHIPPALPRPSPGPPSPDRDNLPGHPHLVSDGQSGWPPA